MIFGFFDTDSGCTPAYNNNSTRAAFHGETGPKLTTLMKAEGGAGTKLKPFLDKLTQVCCACAAFGLLPLW